MLLLPALFLFGFVARIYCWHHFVAPSLGTDHFIVTWYQWIYYPTWGRLDGLLTGISIAALFQFCPKIIARIAGYGNIILLLSIVVLVGAYFVCLDEHTFAASVFGFPLVSIGYGIMVVAAICPSCFLYRYRSRATENIAALSFAIYLCHKGVIHIAQAHFAKLGVGDDGNTMLLLSAICVVAGASLLRILIEKPFLRQRN